MDKKLQVKKPQVKKLQVKKTQVKKPQVKKSREAPKKQSVLKTVCLEGYKISRAGRCIKDKKYQTILATIPVAPPSPGYRAPTSKPKSVQQLISQFEAQKKGKMTPLKLREGDTVSFGLKGPKKSSMVSLD